MLCGKGLLKLFISLLWIIVMWFIGMPLLLLLSPWMLFIILPSGLLLVMKNLGGLLWQRDMIGTCICLSTRLLLISCHLSWIGPLDHIKLSLMTGFHCKSLKFIQSSEDLLLVSMLQPPVTRYKNEWILKMNTLVIFGQFKSRITNHLALFVPVLIDLVFVFVSLINCTYILVLTDCFLLSCIFYYFVSF